MFALFSPTIETHRNNRVFEGFDSQGFDMYGYNGRGVDRAGYSAADYEETIPVPTDDGFMEEHVLYWDVLTSKVAA